MINSKQTTIALVLFIFVSNTYAGECDNVISSNLIDETIAISDTQTISINPWPIIQLNTHCAYDDGWNISSNFGFNEAGNDDIEEINDSRVANANISFSKGNYKIEVGRFLNNMSLNSVFGFALPMGAIPSIQLDEASYSQTVASDVNLIRITGNTEFGSMYVTGYHADKTLKHLSNLHNSFNGGIIKPINKDTNFEVQYANESVENESTRKERLSLFFNISGLLDTQTEWSMAAEINGFKNRDFVLDNDDVTANLYSEISRKNIFPNIDAYVSAGGSFDSQNQASLEAGIFLNISLLLKMEENISIKAGAAQSHTTFQGSKDINTNRYSIQLLYRM